MASSGTSRPVSNGSKQGLVQKKSSEQDKVNGSATSEPTRIPAKASAFEIIAVELQPNTASSPGNGQLHTSNLSLGGITNDTDQEQEHEQEDQEEYVNGETATEGMATESESESMNFRMSVSSQPDENHNSDSSISSTNGSCDSMSKNSTLKSENNGVAAGQNKNVDPMVTKVSIIPVSNSIPSSHVPVIPAPSVSTIKTETGREIAIIKVEAEFRRGRWACSDYHDHRGSSPPLANPSPKISNNQQPQYTNTNGPSTQQVMQNANLQQYPQQTYSSTQQMMEKTEAALNRALSGEATGYSSAVHGPFTFSNPNLAAHAMAPSTNFNPPTSSAAPGAGLSQPGHHHHGPADLEAIEVKVKITG